MSVGKISIIFSHWNTWRWTAIAVHFLKKYEWPFEWELLIADNRPDNPSIKCLTETPLGEGVKIIEGERDFPAHGRGNELCMKAADPSSTHFLFSESDAFPIRDNWANEYIKAAADYDLIGPLIPQSSGPYVHPAGALYSRKIFDRMSEWRSTVDRWLFVPGAGIELGTSDKAFNVIIHKDEFEKRNPSQSLRDRATLRQRMENMQEQRVFRHDTFEDYGRRTGAGAWEPPSDTSKTFNNISYEAGQLAAYFAIEHGFRVMCAPTNLQWMDGFHGQQAAFSDVFGGFRHCWCGTSSFSPAIHPSVRAFKMAQMDHYWQQVPEDIRRHIEKMEAEG